MSTLRTAARTTALTVCAVALCSACAGRSNSLGTNASACYRALPPAESALHSKGRLLGVRRVSTESLQDDLHATTLSTVSPQTLCVFAFAGTFRPGSVAGATNTTSGQYAVVAVGSRHTQVVAAFVVDRLPTRFRHLH